MHPEVPAVRESAARFEAAFGKAPPVAVVLGSGLGKVVERIDVVGRVSSDSLSLPRSTVSGHAGEAIRGRLGGVEVVTLSGRVHLYEGYSAQEVVRSVRALAEWGVERLLLTASVGGIAVGLQPGSMISVNDHISLLSDSPLRGPTYGSIRFPDVTSAYDANMRGALQEAAKLAGFGLPEGVYAAMMGPAYETPAEVRMLRTIGADVVGMSTVPEVLAAAQLQLPVAALAIVANRAAGLSSGPISHDEVTENADVISTKVADLLQHALPRFVR